MIATMGSTLMEMIVVCHDCSGKRCLWKPRSVLYGLCRPLLWNGVASS